MILRPESIAEVQTAVVAHDRLAIRGAGTKSSSPHDRLATLELAGLNGLIEYSPDECVFTALAGTTIAQIESALAAHGQYLPFDPVLVQSGATLGGTVASGLSGSCRHRYGGVRDFVIGMRLVDGEGRLIRSGGKVVKNAAGFLLHHGMVGSLGRFGVIVEITCKVFPRPDARATVSVQCGSVGKAWEAVERIQRARRDLEQADAMLAEIAQASPTLDVVIHNAGGSPYALVAEASPRLLESVIRLNLVAPLQLAQRVNARMQRQPGGGTQLFVGSVSALRPSPGTAAYGAAKAYELILGEGLWDELREHGVDAFSYVIGATATPTFLANAAEITLSPEQLAEIAAVSGQAMAAPRSPESVSGISMPSSAASERTASGKVRFS